MTDLIFADEQLKEHLKKKEKVETLKNKIISDCKEQGFTFKDFNRLINSLQAHQNVGADKAWSQTRILDFL